jgi:hypothetical protein
MRATMTKRRTRALVGTLTALAVGVPAVSAVAAEISGSRLPFSCCHRG